MILTKRAEGIFPLLLMAAITCAGCVKFIADYDQMTADSTIKLSEKTEKFFLDLQYVTKENQTYEANVEKYNGLEAALNALSFRNEARPLNEDTLKQIKLTLRHLSRVRNTHRENGYNMYEFDIYHDEFRDFFKAILFGEQIKPGA
jgi:hypothetical protein